MIYTLSYSPPIPQGNTIYEYDITAKCKMKLQNLSRGVFRPHCERDCCGFKNFWILFLFISNFNLFTNTLFVPMLSFMSNSCECRQCNTFSSANQ